MNNLIYAPVIIPTLNRYEHLKKCLESLSLCTGAEFTDVFIGLDYPAKDSHWEGYKKICEYLNECKLSFKSLVVIKREHNYGFGANGNFNKLIKFVFKNHDRFIASEDDNIFSPNFLEYINKGLDLFQNDKSVLAINGYRHFYPIKSGDNTFFRQSVCFSAWGYGIWRERFESLPKTDFFRENFTLKKFFEVKKMMGADRAFDYASYLFNPPRSWHDSALSIYAFFKKKDIIMPSKKSLVRNMGWDASGEHCIAKKDLCDKHLKQEISESENFEFIGTGNEFYEENQKVFRDYSYAKISELVFIKRFLKFIAKYLIFKTTSFL